MSILKVRYKQVFKSSILAIALCTILLGNLRANTLNLDKVKALKDTLLILEEQADHEIIKLNFSSIYQVINSKSLLSNSDTTLLEELYDIISDDSNPYKLTDVSSYIGRHRSWILSWISPTDGEISFALVKLPYDWETEKEYPMYIYLHGLWDIAGDKIHYSLLPSLEDGVAAPPIAFQDGYLVEPWGRGNLWYRGIAETDIWECVAKMNELFKINTLRNYLAGYSMGGSGAWYIGSRSHSYWAAVGIQSGVVVYEGGFEKEYIEGLSKVPVYFISGEEDDLTQWCEIGYHLLKAAGNSNVEIDVVAGGHDWKQTDTDHLYLWLQQQEKTSQDSMSVPLARVFPNPAKETLYVGGYGEVLDGRFYIYNMHGQFIKQDHCRGRIIDISDLPAGTYIIHIVSNGETSYAKIIKKNI